MKYPYCYAGSRLAMYKYFAFTLMLFSLSLSSGNASATTLEDIEQFNKDQFMDYVRLLDNVEANQENCHLWRLEKELMHKRTQLSIHKQLSSTERRLASEKIRNFRDRCNRFRETQRK